MNQEKLRTAASKLEEEVDRAVKAGYKEALGVLTAELLELIARAKAGQIMAPVELQFTAGPAWLFSETRLGECRELEAAWAGFRAEVEDWQSSLVFRKLKLSLG